MATERSLILFKPDCIQRRLCGQLLCRIENKGMKLVGMKMLQVTQELAREHYAEHVEKPFYPCSKSSSPRHRDCLVVEGPDAIGVMRNCWERPTVGRQPWHDPR
ncbi:MAG: hypothetical protein CM1200mP2_40100 [Planctomycetaceae bacterium]|nr:MAG: hypothetical protein CM1200mP2_40100 [Planctomycetaceae bacterium]